MDLAGIQLIKTTIESIELWSFTKNPSEASTFHGAFVGADAILLLSTGSARHSRRRSR